MTAIAADTRTPGATTHTRPRRILIVVHGYPPHQATGAEVQARRKARWWQQRGHQVSVLAADPQPPALLPFGQSEERVDEVDGITVRRVRFAVPDATRSLQETFAHPALAEALERELALTQPDLLYQVSGYLFGTLPLLAAARRGIPSVLFAMDYWHVCQRVTLLRPDGMCCSGPRDPTDCAACRIADRAIAQRFGTHANRAIRQVVATTGRVAQRTPLGAALGVADFAARRQVISAGLGLVSLAVVNSRFLAEQLANLGVPAARMMVVRQGIDAREFAPSPTRTTRQGGLQVLYLGQVNWHKGTDLAIDAVARLRAEGEAIQLRLHGPVTGPPAYLAQLRDRIARVPGGNEAIGLEPALDRAGIIAALRAADVLVVPSRWYENSPNVILEAFAAGIPVVTANHGGMAEMVRDGVDGLLFDPGDAASLTRVLRRLSVETDLAPRLRAGIRHPYGLDDEMETEEAALDRLLLPVGQ